MRPTIPAQPGGVHRFCPHRHNRGEDARPATILPTLHRPRGSPALAGIRRVP
ncbi:MAG: hypothetical protein ACYCU3_04190 [Streptosporangiaceae bacterium]